MQISVDKTLYWLKHNDNFIILLAYVDNILTISNTNKEIDETIQQFKARFKIRKFDKIERFLRISIEDKVGSVWIHN